jgi:DNA polymerase-3 subunit delta'
MQFKDVIGLHIAKDKLLSQFKQGRVSHAQLFLGQEGGGNFQLALAYAQLINCKNPSENDSCGKCSSCLKYQNFQHPDLYYIFPNNTNETVKKDPQSELFYKEWVNFLKTKPYFSLEDWTEELNAENKQLIINKLDIGSVNKFLSLRKSEGKYKVVLIWWPEKMHHVASNKILKMLEEPTIDSVFLLVGHQSEELLPTIISRLQILNIEKLSTQEITNGLIKIESLPESNAKDIAALCDGDMVKAIKISSNPESGLIYTDLFIRWMRACYELRMENLIEWIDEISNLGREKQKDFISYCLRMLREVLISNYTDGSLNNMNDAESKFSVRFSLFIHAGNISFFHQTLNELNAAIERNGHPKMQLLSVSLKICNYLRLKV